MSGQKVGNIRFNPWYPKATIRCGEDVYHWKFSNLWETQWKIYTPERVQLAYQGWSGKGKVLVNEQEEWLILAGLFISSYYWRLTAVWGACLMPVLLFYFF